MGIESQVLQGIVEQIIVDPDKVEEAMKRHSNVSSELNRITGCRYILSGAYKRKVSVKPLDDVDLFIWFPKSYANSDSIGDLNDNINAADIITKTKKILDYANINCNEIREQSHSVGIFYNDLDFKIDVIPAFAKKDPVEEESFDHLFWIPDRESGKWLPNHPKRNERRIIKANKETKGNFHNIARLLKYWMKQEKSSTFKSFHLELLACYIAYTKPELFDDSLFNVFKNVVGEIEFLVKNKVNISEEIEFEKNILDYLLEDERRYINSLQKLGKLKNQLKEITTNNSDGNFIQNKFEAIFNPRKTDSQTRYTRMDPNAPNSGFG